MARNVTLHCRPYAPVAFPPICCCCLEPATTTDPVTIRVSRLRTGPHTRVRLRYPVQLPYCDAHGRLARIFKRYDRLATIILWGAGLLLLFVSALALRMVMRDLHPLLWWCSSVLLMALLGSAGVAIYALGRKLLQRRYPVPVEHFYTGGLGVDVRLQISSKPTPVSDAILVVTFTLSNDSFATQLAALHGTEAQVVQLP